MMRPPRGFWRLHHAERLLRAQEAPGQVDVDDAAPLLVARAPRPGRRGRPGAGVVEQHVDAAERLARPREERLHRGRVGHVRGHDAARGSVRSWPSAPSPGAARGGARRARRGSRLPGARARRARPMPLPAPVTTATRAHAPDHGAHRGTSRGSHQRTRSTPSPGRTMESSTSRGGDMQRVLSVRLASGVLGAIAGVAAFVCAAGTAHVSAAPSQAAGGPAAATSLGRLPDRAPQGHAAGPVSRDGGRGLSLREPLVRRRAEQLAAREVLLRRDALAPALGRPHHPGAQEPERSRTWT